MQTNVLEYLEGAACTHPDKTAFADEKAAFTFSQFRAAARSLGSILARRWRANRPVAVLADRRAESLVGCFAALYAGDFYVPLDRRMPKARLAAVLADLAPEGVLCSEADRALAEELGLPFLVIGEHLDGGADDTLLARRLGRVLDVDPVYLIYTSGSTGAPKGIVVTHRGVIDLAEWLSGALGYSEADVIGNQTPFYFDASVKDIYLTLKCAATCQILPKKLFMTPVRLVGYLNERKVTALPWATSAFHLVAASGVLEGHRLDYVNKVSAGGEELLASDLNVWKRALPDCAYVNLYGPTEITVDCAWYLVDRGFADGEPVPVGRPCANKEILLLDGDRPCAPGEPGEICVRGIGLSLGYYNDPDKTAAAFVQNPCNPHYRDLIYRTGDIGVWGEDGLLYFQNRRDGQVKHMGYRIELGEIERALSGCAGVTDAVCLFDRAGERILCCYAGTAEEGEVRRALKERLPKYMLPGQFIRLEALPHNANGKIDRPRLKERYLHESSS